MENGAIKNVIITGASRGLGARVAQFFWGAGANIILVGRHLPELQGTIAHFPVRVNQFAYAYAADLSNPKTAHEIMLFEKEKFDHLDVLVNNAAIQGPIGPCWENNMEAWDQTMNVNLISPVRLCMLAVRTMLAKNYGKIINISGGGAAGPRANFSAYGTAKAGLVRFSETLAQETRPYHIDINCVAPGVMNSQLTEGVLKAGKDLAGEQEFETAQKADDKSEAAIQRAAELIFFLGSSGSDGISGKLISAVWDPWENLMEHQEELSKSDIYTLRRIVPKDRGMKWGNK